MKDDKVLRKILADNRIKATRPRLLVFQILRSHGMQSMAELIKASDGKVDRVSIYRTVELFEKLGIVKRIAIGWKYKIELSELFLDHHHHITCLHCHSVVAVKESPASEQMLAELAKDTGFAITMHQIELYGYCKRCATLEKIKN